MQSIKTKVIEDSVDDLDQLEFQKSYADTDGEQMTD